jgi:hypothetical protein
MCSEAKTKEDQLVEGGELVEDYIGREPATAGLSHWQLKPKGYTGEKLFGHMILKRETATVLIGSPARYLDVAISKTNRQVLKNTSELIAGKNAVAKRELMRDAGGDAATQRLAKRKLDSWGHVKSHSGIVNDPARMDRMENGRQLAASLADISHREQMATKQKKTAEASDHLILHADAKIKLVVKGGDVSKLYVKEILALLFCCYDTEAPHGITTKAPLVELLSSKILENPAAVVPAVQT